MKKYLTLIVAFLVFFSISFVPNSSVKANVIDTNSEIFTVTKEVSYDDLSPSDQKDLGPPTEENQVYSVTVFYTSSGSNQMKNQIKAKVDYPVGTFTSTIKTDKKNKRKKTLKWTATSAYHTFKRLDFRLNTGQKTIKWTSIPAKPSLVVKGQKTWTYTKGGVYKVSVSSQAYFNGAKPATLSSIPTWVIVK